MDYYNYRRRKSSIVQIGDTPLGGEYPVRIQSMTNTSTLDTTASVDQCIRIIQAGADCVRLTAQGSGKFRRNQKRVSCQRLYDTFGRRYPLQPESCRCRRLHRR